MQLPLKLFKNAFNKSVKNRNAKLDNSNNVMVYSSVREGEYLLALNEMLSYLNKFPSKVTGYDTIINLPSFKILEYHFRDKQKVTYYYFIETRETKFLKNAEAIDMFLIKDSEQTPVKLYYDIVSAINEEMKKLVDFNKTAFAYSNTRTFASDEEEEYLLSQKQRTSLYYYKDNCEKGGKEEGKSISIKIGGTEYELSVFKVGNNCYKVDFDDIVDAYKDMLFKRYQKIYRI